FLNIFFLNFIMISYEIGTTNNVNIVDETSPPITVIANALDISTELPPPNNNGTKAPIVAMAVINIGRKRVPAASIKASRVDIPLCSILITLSINTIALVTTIPISINIPIILGTEIVSCVINNPATTPIIDTGNENSIANGANPPLNVKTITK